MVPAIARLAAADEDTVRDVIHAFNAKGLAAPAPQWAGGRPRRITDEDIEFIVATAKTRPEKLRRLFTCWSLRKLADYRGPTPTSSDVRRPSWFLPGVTTGFIAALSITKFRAKRTKQPG